MTITTDPQKHHPPAQPADTLPGGDPAMAISVGDALSPEIDPDDVYVVPKALANLVTMVRSTLTAVDANGNYSSYEAVAAVEQAAAGLQRLARHFTPYVN